MRAAENPCRFTLRGESDRVRSAPVGQRNHTLNSAAYSLGQLVAAGALTRDRVAEALSVAAVSAGLEAAEIAATIDSGLAAGARNPRVIQPAPDRSPDANPAERPQRRPGVSGPSTAALPEPMHNPRDKPAYWAELEVEL